MIKDAPPVMMKTGNALSRTGILLEVILSTSNQSKQ
jgi:hypothetical protein